MKQGLEQVEADIREIIAEYSTEVFVVEIALHRGNRSVLSIWVDTDEGITIDSCARISRKLNQYFEESSPFNFPFNLEVSSPGVGRPLKLLRQYHKNVGRKLKVVLNNGDVVKGKLETVTEDSIALLPKAKKKKKGKKQEEAGPEFLEVPFDNIKEAKVEISFD